MDTDALIYIAIFLFVSIPLIVLIVFVCFYCRQMKHLRRDMTNLKVKNDDEGGNEKLTQIINEALKQNQPQRYLF